MIRDSQLLFVFGYPKSGTTYLQTILDSHPEIMCTREGAFHEFGKLLIGPVREYNERLKVKGRLFGEAAYPDVTPVEYRAVLRTFIRTRLLGKAQELSEQELAWIGDKDPDHGNYISTLAELFPGASYVHIVRDCRDVAISWWHHMGRMSPDKARPPFEESCVETSQKWRAYVENVHKVVAEKGLRFHELRYEDLLAAPEAEVNRLLDFLDSDKTDRIVRNSIGAARFDRMNGGRPAGEEDVTSFFRKGVAGDWANSMDEDLQRRVAAAGGPAMGTLGYF